MTGLASFCRAGQWNLGQLIDAMNARLPRVSGCDDEPRVVLDFGYLVPTGLSSYRGFYEQLAIDYDDLNTYRGDGAPTVVAQTVSTFLRRLEQAAAGEVFEGYKGGSYRASRASPLWVASYGEASSVAVVGLHDDDPYNVRIKTGWVPT